MTGRSWILWTGALACLSACDGATRPDAPDLDASGLSVGTATAEPVLEDAADSCGCPNGAEVVEDGTGCLVVDHVDPLPLGAPAQVCEAEPHIDYTCEGATFEDGTTVEDGWWGIDNSQPDGRLNDVGVAA